MGSSTVDVLIIGGGVAGPALAAALAPHRLRVLLVERDAGPPDTARGDHLQPRVVEILDRWGALDEFVRRGAERRTGTMWFDDVGNLLVRAMLEDADLPFPHFLVLDHERISEALLAAASMNPRLTVHRPVLGWDLLESGPDGCTVRIDDGREQHTIGTSVLVGADGQASRVRYEAGIETETHRYRRPISIFFAPYTERPEGNSLTAHIGDRGIVALVPRRAGICKIGVATDPDELSAWRRLDGPGIRRRLEHIARGLPIGEPRHVGTYPPVRITAERWARDAVVLLGDACHAMHPAQSQGMNVAIRCADALAEALNGGLDDPSSAIAAYERHVRPALAPLLDANHQAGMLFDATSPEPLAHFAAMLRQLGEDEDAALGYALTTAGYPPQ
ncbi:MAG: NAD(P)/FAD-dependent oxidoreductase [Actinomycetota bacterium]